MLRRHAPRCCWLVSVEVVESARHLTHFRFALLLLLMMLLLALALLALALILNLILTQTLTVTVTQALMVDLLTAVKGIHRPGCFGSITSAICRRCYTGRPALLLLLLLLLLLVVVDGELRYHS